MAGYVDDLTLEQILVDHVPVKHHCLMRSICRLVRHTAPEFAFDMVDGYHKDMMVPLWHHHDDAIVLLPSKSGITIEFTKGASFLDPFDLLQGQGRAARRLKLRHMKDFDQEALSFLIKEAVRLDIDGHHQL